VDGEIAEIQEDLSNRYSHAENINVFIESVLRKSGFEELDAIAVSEGPGSYTGLRIGVSTAKGFCFGKSLPLISVNPLEAMAAQVKGRNDALRIPMIDARRMEVFCAGFNFENKEVFKTRAEVVNPSSFQDVSGCTHFLIFGDGADKCREILNPEQFHFIDIYASAFGMAGLADTKYRKKDFVDLAYFEPYYLKDFVAGKPKKGLR